MKDINGKNMNENGEGFNANTGTSDISILAKAGIALTAITSIATPVLLIANFVMGVQNNRNLKKIAKNSTAINSKL